MENNPTVPVTTNQICFHDFPMTKTPAFGRRGRLAFGFTTLKQRRCRAKGSKGLRGDATGGATLNPKRSTEPSINPIDS